MPHHFSLFFITWFVALLSFSAQALPPCTAVESYVPENREVYANFYQRTGRQFCEKDWSVLIYMEADNNLFPYALYDLNEIEAGFASEKSNSASSKKMDVVVQVNGTAGNPQRRLHLWKRKDQYVQRARDDFASAHLDDVASPIVEMAPLQKSQAQELTDFLRWGAQKYPAKHYLVVVWGHGQGWKSSPLESLAFRSPVLSPSFSPTNPIATLMDGRFGGIAFRQNSDQWLDIPHLRQSLREFKQSIGKAIDIYASDACLMQMLEVSTEISEATRYIVGSAQLQDFLGLPYRRIFYEMNSGKFGGEKSNAPSEALAQDEAFLVAKMIPSLMKKSLDPQRGLHGRNEKEAQKFMTSSALSTGELQRNLLPEIQFLGSALREYMREDLLRSLDLLNVLKLVPSIEGGAQDFGVFLGLLELLLVQEKDRTGVESTTAGKLKQQIANTKIALDQSILAYSYGSAYNFSGQSKLGSVIPRAVSLWLPTSESEYRSRKDEFASSRFFQETKWKNWLNLVFGVKE